jgi:hypothetical protein
VFGIRDLIFVDGFFDRGLLIGCLDTADERGGRPAKSEDVPAIQFLFVFSLLWHRLFNPKTGVYRDVEVVAVEETTLVFSAGS